MSKVILLNTAELEEKFIELLGIAHQVRKYKKKWEAEYGAVNRGNLARWEEKLDTFLLSLNISHDDAMADIKK